MRVFYEEGSLIVEGTKQAYPAKSLITSQDGNRISIYLRDTKTRIASSDYSVITDKSGQGFNDVASALAYLNSEFNKSPSDSLAFTPTPDISATTYQGAIEENRTELSQQIVQSTESANFVVIFENALV